MKKLILILFSFSYFTVSAQSFEWVETIRLIYNLNPEYPDYPVDYDEVNNKVVHARLDSFDIVYGQNAYGSTWVESRDTNGILDWWIILGSTVNIQRIVVDQNGEIYVGGQFQNVMNINGFDTLNPVPGSLSPVNAFLIKLDASGNLIWKRNLSHTWPNTDGIEALGVDNNKDCWYAVTDFINGAIVEVDNSGNDMNIHNINAKRIGNICFDDFGGMYVSGAADNGTFTIDNTNYTVPFSYAMFIARIDPAGQPSWAHFGHDITFQKPMVVRDPDGNAIFACNRYDTLSFNGAFIPGPYLTGDFFAVKFDSSGAVNWTLFQPPLMIGPFGAFEPGKNLFLDTDASGNIYMGGVQQGTVDWGNGYVSSTTGFTDKKIAIACIDSSGATQWVKMGGSRYNNYIPATTASSGGSVYWTGSFMDTAYYDWFAFETTNLYNFAIGKIRILPVSIDDPSQVSELNVYPNPAHEFVNLPESAAGSDVSVFDAAGRELISVKEIRILQIDVGKLNSGSYLMLIRNGNKQHYFRLIKTE